MSRVAAMVLLSLLAALAGGCDPHAADKDEIRQVYADYMAFRDRGNGKGILEVISETSYPYYERLIKVALEGTPDDLGALGPSERLEVFRMRARAKRAEIEKLTGRQYAEFATARRWHARPPDMRTEDVLKVVRFKGDAATAEWVMDGRPTGVTLRFVREDDRWRLDVREPDWCWEEVAKLTGEPVDRFLIDRLRRELGHSFDREALWRPMTQ